MMRAAIIFTSAMLFFSSSCLADPLQNTAKAEKAIRSHITDLQIDGVQPLKEFPGLYEIRSGHNIFYSNANGTYLISGHIYRTRDHLDLTAARLEDVNRVDWNMLPLQNAIASGDPEGTPLVVFTDPDCPYCRKLEGVLDQTKGLKVYTFLYPLERIHPQARAKAEAIWCAKKQHKTMQDVMLRGTPLDKLPKATCSTPIAENLALGRRLGVMATPTLIARDGRKHTGIMEADKLMHWARR